MRIFHCGDKRRRFNEDGAVIGDTGTSTLSGIIEYNDDYLIFTTGHGLNVECRVDSDYYTLKDFMWPYSIRNEQIQNDEYFKSNIAKDAKMDSATVSDVAVLQPHKDVQDKFLAKKQCFIKQDFIQAYHKDGNPVLPNREQIEGEVEFSGYKTNYGEMIIKGTACIGREFVYKSSEGKRQRLLFYERLYVAKPKLMVPSKEIQEHVSPRK